MVNNIHKTSWSQGHGHTLKKVKAIPCNVNRVFHSLYKVGRNGNFVFKGFYNSKKKLPLVGLDLMLQIITGLGVQCLNK